MVYHFFGSKEGTFQAALRHVYKRLEDVEFEAIESNGSSRHKLSRLPEGYFAFLDANPEFTRLLLWANVDHGPHILKARHMMSKNAFIARFRQTVEEGIRGGELRTDINVSHTLIHFIGLCLVALPHLKCYQ